MPIVNTSGRCRPSSRRRLLPSLTLLCGGGLAFAPAVTSRADKPLTARPSLVASTRTLYRYTRSDRADLLTQVTLDAGQRAAQPIQPYVFGNFIEHLGGVIYEGLWAQALLNPSLEQIEPNDKQPPEWKLNDGAEWLEGGYASPRGVRLHERPGVQTRPHPGGSVEQVVRLPLQRCKRYVVRFWARADKAPVSLQIALESTKSYQTATDVDVVITSKTWQPYTATLTLTPQDIAPDLETQGVNIVLTYQPVSLNGRIRGNAAMPSTPLLRTVSVSGQIRRGSSVVDVDQITLFPADSDQSSDADVVARARAWQMPLMRWPGGNFVSGYNWQDGIGPVVNRPTRRNPAWGGVEPNHFGTHEFMRFIRGLDVPVQITVNAGDGTPENAADWVRYCNEPATSTWGAKRAANGDLNPFNVRVWEIGNELYGGWQIGHTDAPGNAARYVRFRDAMLRADPKLRLLATGKGEEFIGDGLKRNEEWNRALLTAALANGGQAPDWLTVHPLVWLPGIVGGSNYSEQYESAMAHATWLGDTYLPSLAGLIAQVEGPNPRTKIAATEWGIIIGGDTWEQAPNHDSLAGAIYNGLALNSMLRNSDQITLANMTAFMHGGGIKKWNGHVYVDPQYYTQQLYAASRPHTPIGVTVVGPGRDVPQRGGLPAVANVPDVDVTSALSADGKRLLVYAVNRLEHDARPLTLSLKSFRPASLRATILTAPDPRARNGWDKIDAIRPQPFGAKLTGANTATGAVAVTLPAHSLTVFTFTQSGVKR